MRRRYVSMGLMMFALALATAGISAAPQQVTLELKGKPGDALKYKTGLDLRMDLVMRDRTTGEQTLALKPQLSGTITTSQHVRDVAANGDLSIGEQIESFDLALDVADLHARLAIQGPGDGAPEIIKLPHLPVQVRISKQGKPLAIEGLDELPIPPLPGPTGGKIDIGELSANLITRFAQPLCPDKPVGVGDKWEWEIVVDPLEMLEMMQVPVPSEAKQQLAQIRIPIKNTSTLVGFEEVKGVECARIEAVAPWLLKTPLGGREGNPLMLDESGLTKVVTLFDYTAGRKVTETTDIEVAVTLTSGSVTRVQMTMRGHIRTELKQ